MVKNQQKMERKYCCNNQICKAIIIPSPNCIRDRGLVVKREDLDEVVDNSCVDHSFDRGILAAQEVTESRDTSQRYRLIGTL